GLRERFGNNQGSSAFFKKLFNNQEGPELLRHRLGRILTPFGSELSDIAQRTYSRIEKTVVDSIWLRDKVTPKGVKVRSADLAVEEELPYPEFVAELMRAYRNGHHGYFTAGDRQKRPSRFLYLVDGNL